MRRPAATVAAIITTAITTAITTTTVADTTTMVTVITATMVTITNTGVADKLIPDGDSHAAGPGKEPAVFLSILSYRDN
jgi:hypothetical protein